MLLGAKSAAVDWLVVGLGNPGAKYEHTRHNMGFLTVDLLAEQAGVKLNKVKFKSAYNIIPFAGSKCLVMKPQTYMNLSGEAVREAVQFYKIPADRVLVIDDGKVAMFEKTDRVFAQSARLSQMGLRVPQITKIMTMLREKGYPVSSGVLTVEQGVQEILRILGREEESRGQ